MSNRGYERLDELERIRARWLYTEGMMSAFWIAVALTEKGYERREFIEIMQDKKRSPPAPKLIELWAEAAVEIERAGFLDRQRPAYKDWKREREEYSTQMAVAIIDARRRRNAASPKQ